jgi:hypothetical protein
MTVLTNRLATQPSLYLRQHASNPVAWQPWDEQSLQLARDEQRLLVISIGYAACHWCHVMEHESFDDAQVAALMNEHFVPIKIDRETRPDLDAVYMDALQLMNGQGGWPLNIIALPDGRPVYGGTYFRKNQWLAVLEQLATMWQNERSRMEEYANKMQEGLETMNHLVAASEQHFRKEEAARSLAAFRGRLDAVWGGLSGAPKFPMPPLLRYLLDQAVRSKDAPLLDQLMLTADRMAGGGIYDNLGGGFCRYSVDDQWRVPHFEKMLYDNGQLLSFYAELYRATGKSHYRRLLYEIDGWCRAALLQPEGAYGAAWDADSEGEEGKYYVWTLYELQQLLDEQELSLARQLFELDDLARWEGPLLVLQWNEAVYAAQPEQADALRAKLESVRSKREEPARDRKMLLAWNALQLEGLCEAYAATSDRHFLDEALRLAKVLETFRENGLWMRVNYGGQLSQPAFSEDLAYLGRSFFRLYEVSGSSRWLKKAQALADELLNRFAAAESGLLAWSAQELELPLPKKYELADNVQPSANSVFARLLGQLAELTLDMRYYDHMEQMWAMARPHLDKYAHFHGGWMQLGLEQAYGRKALTITGSRAQEVHRELLAQYRPDRLLLMHDGEGEAPALFAGRASTSDLRIDACSHGSCALPIYRVEDLD